MQSILFTDSLALFKAGRSIEAKIAMIAITMRNSIKVKQADSQVDGRKRDFSLVSAVPVFSCHLIITSFLLPDRKISV